jgi:hypothetical protein
MLNQIKDFSPDCQQHSQEIEKIEQQMFNDWMLGLAK